MQWENTNKKLVIYADELRTALPEEGEFYVEVAGRAYKMKPVKERTVLFASSVYTDEPHLLHDCLVVAITAFWLFVVVFRKALTTRMEMKSIIARLNL